MQLTAEQDLIRESAREFCVREIVPFAREWDRAEELDRAIVGTLAAAGYLGAALPEEYGGQGLDTVSYALIAEELGRADSSVRGIVSVNIGLVGKTIVRWGTGEQKQALLPGVVQRRGAGLLRADRAGVGVGPSEPRHARRARRLRLAAERLEDLHHARHLGGLRPRLRAYRRAGPARHHLLHRPDRRRRLRVAPDQGQARAARPGHRRALPRRRPRTGLSRLGDEGAGFKVAMSALDNGRISLAAGCVGISQGCLDASIDYAGERTQFGRPIASFQLVQELIADMAVETDAARLLTGARRLSPTRASPTRSIVDREVLRERGRRCAPRTRRSRCTAGTATSTSTRSASTSATRA